MDRDSGMATNVQVYEETGLSEAGESSTPALGTKNQDGSSGPECPTVVHTVKDSNDRRDGKNLGPFVRATKSPVDARTINKLPQSAPIEEDDQASKRLADQITNKESPQPNVNRPGTAKDGHLDIQDMSKLLNNDNGSSQSPVHAQDLPLDQLPDWTPASLSWLPYVATLVLAAILTYIVLFAWSRAHGIICKASPGVDNVFLHGPAFLGLLIGELLSRMTFDIESIGPYLEMSKQYNERSLQRAKRAGLMLAEPPEGPSWNILRHPMKCVLLKLNHLIEAAMNRKAKITYFISLFSTVALPALLSATFAIKSAASGTLTQEFRKVDIDSLITSVDGSMIPSLGMTGFLNATNFNDLYWMTYMDNGKNLADPSWVGVTPFAPESDDTIANNGDREWTATTDVLYSAMRCMPLLARVKVSQYIDYNLTTTLVGVSLEAEDTRGCRLTSFWDTISTTQLSGLHNPIITNGSSPTFALWASTSKISTISSGLPRNSTVSEGCNPFHHFIISGPLGGNVSEFTTDEIESGWSGISCTVEWYIDSNIAVSVRKGSFGISGTPDLVPGRGTHPGDEQTNILNTVMLENFVANSLVYSFGEPSYTYSFWGEVIASPITMVIAGLVQLFGTPEMSCEDVHNADESWTREQCRAYIIVASLWSIMTAGIPMFTTPFLPSSGWQSIEGSTKTYETGWLIETFPFGFAVILLLLTCAPLVLERRLRLPGYLTSAKRSGQKSLKRSGLYGTTSSIVGLAFCFQDSTVRKLLEGVDLMENNKARQTIAGRLGANVLLLRRWRNPPLPGGDPDKTFETPALIKSTFLTSSQQQRSSAEQVPDQEPEEDALEKLTYGDVPVILSWWLLLILLLVIIAIIIAVFVSITHLHDSTFLLWHQKPNREAISAQLVSYIQRLILSGLPPLVLGVLSSLWWSEIDLYFRRTQPFAALRQGALGVHSIGLQYVHDFHGAVTFKAVKHGHLWLALITFVTLLGKVGIVLAVGIFKPQKVFSGAKESVAYYSVFRDRTFPVSVAIGEAFQKSFKQVFLSLLIFDYTSLTGWKAGYTQFPMLWMERSRYNVTMDGVRGMLTCTNNPVEFEQMDNNTVWRATLEGGDCAGSARSYLPGITTDQHQPAVIVWTYLNRTSCPTLPSSDSGRWWVINTSLEEMSLLCTPIMSLDTIDLTVEALEAESLNDESPTIAIADIVQQQRLSTDHWSASGDIDQLISVYGNDATNFLPFFSMFLNMSLFTPTLFPATESLSLDYLGVMLLVLAGGSTKAVNGRPLSSPPDMDFSTFATFVNETFALALNALIAMDLVPIDWNSTSDISSGETILMQHAPANYSKAMAHPELEHVFLQPGALYAGVGVLFLYILCIPIVFTITNRKRGGWRPPRNMAFPANILPMLYDSSLMLMLHEYPTATTLKARSVIRNLVFLVPDWRTIEWGFGIFRGSDGLRRVGIEVVDKLEGFSSSRDRDFDRARRRGWFGRPKSYA